MRSLQKIDWVLFWSFVCLTLLAIYFGLYPDRATPIQLSTYQKQLLVFQGALLAVFLASLVGNILPVPTPYVVVLWLAALKYCELGWFYPLFLAFIASLGSLLGEILSYLVGRGLNSVPDIRESKNLSFFSQILLQNPRWAPVLIFLFGATPLNDDFLMVPLGIIQYPAKKTVVFCWLGKLAMMIGVAYLPDIFSISNPQYSFLTTMVPLYLIVLMLYLMFRIDWLALLKKSAFFQKLFHFESLNNNEITGDDV